MDDIVPWLNRWAFYEDGPTIFLLTNDIKHNGWRLPVKLFLYPTSQIWLVMISNLGIKLLLGCMYFDDYSSQFLLVSCGHQAYEKHFYFTKLEPKKKISCSRLSATHATDRHAHKKYFSFLKLELEKKTTWTRVIIVLSLT